MSDADGPAAGSPPPSPPWPDAGGRRRRPPGWLLVAAVAIASLVIAVVVSRDDSGSARGSAGGGDTSSGAGDELQGLRDDCGDGDLSACDELYWAAPADSEMRDFAITCGRRDPGGRHPGSCDEDLG
jgi:hypothetical protein